MQTFEILSLQPIRMSNNILSTLLMITLVVVIHISFMRNHNFWTCSKILKPKLKINYVRKLNPSNLIINVNILGGYDRFFE